MSYARFQSNFVNEQEMAGTHHRQPNHVLLQMGTTPLSSTQAPFVLFHRQSSTPSSFNLRPVTSTSGRPGYQNMNAGSPQVFNTHSKRHAPHGLQPTHFRHTNNASNPITSGDIRGVSAPRTGYSRHPVSSKNGTKASSTMTAGRSEPYILGSQRNRISSTSNSGYSASSHGIPRMHSQTTSSNTGTMNRSNLTSSYVSSSYSASARPQTQWYSQGLHHNSALHLNSEKIPGHRARRRSFPWKPRRNRSTSPSIRELLRASMRTH